MFAAVSAFKGIAKLSHWAPKTENFIFQLHSRVTVLLLLLFSALVTMDLFFGKPIECMTTHEKEYPSNYINSYCWMHATYTVASAYDKKIGVEVIAPGVAKAVGDQTYQHSYYQWVGFFLFFSGVFFYIPHYIWKVLEGKRIEKILLGLNHPLAEKESERDENVHKLAVYLQRSKGGNDFYAFGYSICEMLNLAVVIGMIYMTDSFLGGEFTEYGTEVVAFSQMEFTNRTDPMVKLFPRLAKCTVHKFGPSGSIQNHDILCVLPINVANEKIFIFLWFWYCMVAVISGLALIYRILLMVFVQLRLRLLRCSCRYADRIFLKNLVVDHMGTYSDWFVLRLLVKNMNAKNFCKLIEELDNVIKEELKTLTNSFALTITRNRSWENGDTMPIEVKTNIYGVNKARLSSSKLNGNN